MLMSLPVLPGKQIKLPDDLPPVSGFFGPVTTAVWHLTAVVSHLTVVVSQLTANICPETVVVLHLTVDICPETGVVLKETDDLCAETTFVWTETHDLCAETMNNCRCIDAMLCVFLSEPGLRRFTRLTGLWGFIGIAVALFETL